MEEYSAFAQFIGQYGRSYATKDEHESRFEAFRVNYRDVQEHNLRYESGDVSWRKGINKFTDMTEQEFKAMYLSAMIQRKQPDGDWKPHLTWGKKIPKELPVDTNRVPDEVDWYAAGKVSESID